MPRSAYIFQLTEDNYMFIDSYDKSAKFYYAEYDENMTPDDIINVNKKYFKDGSYNYNKFPKGNQYQPLLNKKKIHQKHNEIKNNTNKNINFKKEASYKRGELMAQIYQPDKNINYSPSFTPIKYNKN